MIEFLVVIAIVGVLSTLAIVSFNNSRSKARDTERLSDIRSIQEAVELYIEDNSGDAPDPAAETWVGLEGILGTYMQTGALPVDPSDSDGYMYVYCHSGYNYLLAAVMENDQEITNDIDGAHGYTVATECIFSKADINILSCADTGGGGNISGITGSAFCAGYQKGA